MKITIIIISQKLMNHIQVIILTKTLARGLFHLFELPNKKSKKDKQAVWFTQGCSNF